LKKLLDHLKPFFKYKPKEDIQATLWNPKPQNQLKTTSHPKNPVSALSSAALFAKPISITQR
jgi:hypothetical protein